LRKILGLLILLIGWITLGLTGSGAVFTGWHFGKDAKEIEAFVSERAQAQVGQTTYPVQTNVSGRDIRVSGTVANFAEKTAVLTSIEQTTGRRVVIDELKLITIVSPYVFRGSKNESGLFFEGNAPTKDTLSHIIGPAGNTLTLAGGMPDPYWPALVKLGAQGIAMLENGAFDISNRTMTVTGLAGSLEEKAAVVDVYKNLTKGYEVNVNLDVAPTVPYIFTGTRSESGDVYSGYVPSAAEAGGLAGLIGDASSTLKPTAGMPDKNWLSVVGVGIKAMKGLNAGQLSISGRDVSLIGSVNTPDAISTIEKLFSAMPEGYSAKVDLNSLDDGTPAELNLDWIAGKGGVIHGKGPDGVSMDDLTAALNLPKLGGIFRQGKVRGKETIMKRFSGIGATLPLLESVSAQIAEDHVEFNGVLLPGGDLEEVEATLYDSLGEEANILLARSALEPKEGDVRVNEDTGKKEIHRGGFWLVTPKPKPVSDVNVEPVPKVVPKVVIKEETVVLVSADVLRERCVSTTADIMADSKITFETGSAVLTKQSRELLSRLGAVMRACAGVNGLSVDVGGHTDSQGSEEFNLDLSQQRATAVREALIENGVEQTAITATGFGEAQPIATNDTGDGRAQNRRTTFEWITK